MRGDWRRQANIVIDAVLRELPADMPIREKRKAINERYPFGLREHHPYKIWCDAVRIALGLKKKRKTAGIPADTGPDLFSSAE